MSGGLCAPLPELKKRVKKLEAAVLALYELGDSPGHEFRGNQYTYIASYSEDHAAMARGEYKEKKIRVMAKDEPTANLYAAQMVARHGIPTATKLISTRLEAKLASHSGEATVKPGDVIVDPSGIPAPHLHDQLVGATIVGSKQAMGVGTTDVINNRGQEKSITVKGGTVIVDRPV